MLKIENISFTYPGGDPVLEDVSIHLKKGKKTALIGPNGSGKTTLFLLCCGILQPKTGRIEINSKDVLHKKFNPEISYLFQSPDDQLFSSTIYDDVAFGPLNMGLEKEEIRKRVEKSLDRVDSSNLSDRAPFHLSGGQKRMAAIASLLSMTPEVLLFDEPTANLDNRNKRKVIELINSMTETLFISSHDLEFLLETCSEVILLDEGRIIKEGPIKEILSDRELMVAHGLEMPHSLIPHRIPHHN
jgi:cobalt/nickel transport system ATP-binding protein